MKNADMPAMPSTTDPQSASFLREFSGGVHVETLARWNAGLTKREHFSGLVLQGLVASWGQHDVTDMRELAEDAVSMADALLAELERTS